MTPSRSGWVSGSRDAARRRGAAEMMLFGDGDEEAQLLEAGQGYHRFFRSKLI
jgi:hypothetical protein